MLISNLLHSNLVLCSNHSYNVVALLQNVNEKHTLWNERKQENKSKKIYLEAKRKSLGRLFIRPNIKLNKSRLETLCISAQFVKDGDKLYQTNATTNALCLINKDKVREKISKMKIKKATELSS